ncbi:MAG: ribulose-phosphate 3-epimerase [Oceanipulchritudo sp.]
MNNVRPRHPSKLVPSILAADHAHLAAGLEAVQSLPVEWLHLDIMDGHFVPNFSFGPQTVAALRQRDPDLYFDTHLMLDNPHRHVDAFIEAGSNLVSIHLEPEYDIPGTLASIRGQGCSPGIVLNPATPAEAALPFLESVDLILVMTVWPGFGGQAFMPEALPKIRQLHEWRSRRDLPYRIEVDGGIDRETAPQCRGQGADTFVAGTAFFKAPDRSAFLEAIEGDHEATKP